MLEQSRDVPAGERDRVAAARRHLVEDGRPVETYRRIGLPLVRPGLATCALIAFAGIWNAYLVPLVYLGQQPGYQTLTIALVQYSRRFQTAYHLLAAGQVIALVPVVVAFVVLQRHFVRGLIGGAMRG